MTDVSTKFIGTCSGIGVGEFSQNCHSVLQNYLSKVNIKFSTFDVLFPSSETGTLLFKAIDLKEVEKP
jgi:hypothetical protein